VLGDRAVRREGVGIPGVPGAPRGSRAISVHEGPGGLEDVRNAPAAGGGGNRPLHAQRRPRDPPGVIDFYDRGGGDDPRKSPVLRPLGLSKEEKESLREFLATGFRAGCRTRARPPSPESLAVTRDEALRRGGTRVNSTDASGGNSQETWRRLADGELSWEALRMRARLLEGIRGFFRERDSSRWTLRSRRRTRTSTRISSR